MPQFPGRKKASLNGSCCSTLSHKCRRCTFQTRSATVWSAGTEKLPITSKIRYFSHILSRIKVVSNADRITFIVEGNSVRLVNSSVYAMQVLQNEMAREAQRTSLNSEEDVMALVKEMRNEDERV